VHRILAGDDQACAQLVKAHSGCIFRFLFHLCRDAHTAEDLAQETFAGAWMHLASFNGSSTLATWLHRIAYCKFVDWRRRSQRSSAVEQSLRTDQVRSAGPQPADQVQADEQSQALYRAIAALDQAGREVIILHYLQGLSYRQMSAVLAEPAGTVKWRTSRALAQLKRLLDAGLGDENDRQT
jgi:RNA polymerase sigma-70 factor (ECF subfamily)